MSNRNISHFFNKPFHPPRWLMIFSTIAILAVFLVVPLILAALSGS